MVMILNKLMTTLLLSGCSMMKNESSKDTNTTKSVPEEMDLQKMVRTRIPTI